MVKTVFDTSSLENEQLKLEEELNIVADKVNNCILPKTGESASLVALFASLAFFVAGLLMHKKKVVRESK